MNETLFPDPAPTAPGELYTAHCDGGSRGNPGPSGYGAVIEDAKGRVVARLSDYLGIQTNNYAEYSGLLAVLHWAVENGAQRLRVISDSELMVKQMQGKYAVKSPILRPLYEEARRLSRSIASFEMHHTLRAGNHEADRLANEAMDKAKQGTGNREQGTGSGVSGVRNTGAASLSINQPAVGISAPAAPRAAPQPTAKPAHLILEGYVKDGVVHLLGGELPDGIFVKIIRE
jgi:probable phosphoglycerate mutase